MKAPKYVIAPKGCANYLTPGKRYPVMNFDDTGDGIGFDTIDDDGVELYASLNDSAHLNGGNWIIPDEV